MISVTVVQSDAIRWKTAQKSKIFNERIWTKNSPEI